MDKDALINRLASFGFHSQKHYTENAFSRNIGLLTQEEQDLLADVRIGIPGMGGVGGVHLITLTRTGVGRFSIADFDTFEAANANRQYGARIPDFGHSKLETMKREALSINPYLDIREFKEGVNPENLDEFLDGLSVVLDSLDYFAFDIRRKLFNRAREKGVYVITAGPMGFSSALLVFSPYEGMTFDEYFNISDDMAPTDCYIAFGIGLAPRPTHFRYVDFSKVDLDKQSGPSLHIACQLCSAMAATEALKIILKRGEVKPVPHYLQFDPYLAKLQAGKLLLGNRHPVQKLKIFIAKKMTEKKRERHHTETPALPQVTAEKTALREEVIRYLIRAGIQAPSGDNAQPWRFAYGEEQIDIYLDRNADTSFFNVAQTASLISLGAVIENITIAAGRNYLTATANLFPDTNTPDLVASIHLSERKTNDAILADSIFKRQTSRKPFKKRPLSPRLLSELENAAQQTEGARLHFITERGAIEKLGDLIFDIDRIRSEHRALHEHLHQMIRHTPKEAEQRRDGLPLKNLEAGLAGEMILKLTRPWPIMNLMNKAGLGKMIAHVSRQGIVNAGAAALLTMKGASPEAFIRGGQALERVWLTLTRKGLFMQPMTAVTLFYRRWQIEGGVHFTEAHNQRFPMLWEVYRSLFPQVDFAEESHIMLFRMGYGAGTCVNTYRKEIDDLMKK